MIEAVRFLLRKGANPHIMDLSGQDACDMAKKQGSVAREIAIFNNCNPHQKILPLMPNGQHAELNSMVFFPDQIGEDQLKHLPFKFKRQADVEKAKENGIVEETVMPYEMKKTTSQVTPMTAAAAPAASNEVVIRL